MALRQLSARLLEFEATPATSPGGRSDSSSWTRSSMWPFASRRSPPAGAGVASGSDGDADVDPFTGCTDELQIRATLRTAEPRAPEGYSDDVPPPPVPMLRQRAVLRLAEIELDTADSGPRSPCRDLHLDQLLAELDPGPAVQRQLATAYCVQRSTQLLAGHAVDADSAAIHRLALWTILDLEVAAPGQPPAPAPAGPRTPGEETPRRTSRLSSHWCSPIRWPSGSRTVSPGSSSPRTTSSDSARRSGRARPRVMTCTTGAHRPPPSESATCAQPRIRPANRARVPRQEADRLGVDPAARDHPRDDRVRVPHLTRSKLVATPHRSEPGRPRRARAAHVLRQRSVAEDCQLPLPHLECVRRAKAGSRSGRSGNRPAQRLPTAPSATTPRCLPLQS